MDVGDEMRCHNEADAASVVLASTVEKMAARLPQQLLTVSGLPGLAQAHDIEGDLQ